MPYYIYAWNRLISSLSFATQFLQTTRKRLYSDNSIQSSAYIKWIQKLPYSFPPTDKLFPVTVWLTAVNLTLLDLICLFVCRGCCCCCCWYPITGHVTILQGMFSFNSKLVIFVLACTITFSVRAIYGPLAHSANKILVNPLFVDNSLRQIFPKDEHLMLVPFYLFFTHFIVTYL